jgi:hypothetical protein
MNEKLSFVRFAIFRPDIIGGNNAAATPAPRVEPVEAVLG